MEFTPISACYVIGVTDLIAGACGAIASVITAWLYLKIRHFVPERWPFLCAFLFILGLFVTFMAFGVMYIYLHSELEWRLDQQFSFCHLPPPIFKGIPLLTFYVMSRIDKRRFSQKIRIRVLSVKSSRRVIRIRHRA